MVGAVMLGDMKTMPNKQRKRTGRQGWVGHGERHRALTLIDRSDTRIKAPIRTDHGEGATDYHNDLLIADCDPAIEGGDGDTRYREGAKN